MDSLLTPVAELSAVFTGGNEATGGSEPEDAGQSWRVDIVADDHGEIKPRRGVPQIRAHEFFGGLVQDNSAWMYPGEINGWPGITHLRLERIQGQLNPHSLVEHTEDVLKKAGQLIGLSSPVKCLWDHDSSTVEPGVVQDMLGCEYQRVSATMVRPFWSLRGWSQESPGFAFWVCAQQNHAVKVLYGKQMLDAADAGSISDIQGVCSSSQAVRAHHIVHRYWVPDEFPMSKDRFSWHALVLVEWDHGQFCTVLELGYRNGLGGYGAKSNWFHDRDANPPKLLTAFPGCMQMPWLTEVAEVRATDVEARNVKEFEEFLSHYTDKRFIAPCVFDSGAVRLAYRSQKDLMRYLLNYIQRDGGYRELSDNCQAFAADMFGFLTAKKNVKPYAEVHQALYTDRKHMFLYEPDMFDDDSE